MKLDWAPVALPVACIRSGYSFTLFLTALSPIVLIAIATACLIAKRVWTAWATAGSFGNSVKQAVVAGLFDSTYLLLVVSFYFVSEISQNIFNAFTCTVYHENSARFEERSFLSADLSVSCDSTAADNEDYEYIKAVAFVFMAVWPIGQVVLYVMLLLLCRRALNAEETTTLTRATRFLHADYKTHFYWWEVCDCFLAPLFIPSRALSCLPCFVLRS